MDWKEDFKEVARLARKPETIGEAAERALALAQAQPDVAGRIEVALAWYRIHSPANWQVAPPWERVLEGVPHERALDDLLRLGAGEGSLAPSAWNLVRIHARAEDAPRLWTPTLAACRGKEDVAGTARGALLRLAALDPDGAERLLPDLWASKARRDHLLALLLLQSEAGRRGLRGHLERVLALVRKAEAAGADRLLAHLAALPGEWGASMRPEEGALLAAALRQVATDMDLDETTREQARLRAEEAGRRASRAGAPAEAFSPLLAAFPAR